MAELWVRPEPNRDLYYGVGGKALAPDPAARYTVIEIKRSGYSSGYTVKDEADREWSVKFPPEAPTETTASRILWGIGYHQPPVYYVPSWNARKATSPNPQMSARFREKKPDLHGLDAKSDWSYYQNPFVGTREMNGLLVLQAMLGNSDLKDAQNALYKLKQPFEGAKRWYVARDLGQTFGRTGVVDAPRGDLGVFEQTPFITGVADGTVQFDYRGRHRALFAEDHAGGRPLDLHATLPPHRRAVARRVSRRRLCETRRRSLHPQDEAEDRRRPRAEGLMRYLRFTPRLVSAVLVALVLTPAALRAQPPKAVEREQTEAFKQSIEGAADKINPMHEIYAAMIRLPLAALLGAALALRPRRRGTPPRDPAVIQTQIILAVVGAVIMLVVGASLARAFGIVGAANLIRYRSKIDDPKDAVVMLCTLAVGLASGVGLYAPDDVLDACFSSPRSG